jgi:AAA domain
MTEDAVMTDLSLSEDYEDDVRSKDYVEPPPISEADYFALTDEGKGQVARDPMGKPIGFWSLWSEEGRNRYRRENPPDENKGPPRRDAKQEPVTFSAQPYIRRDPKTIPPRQWLHAGHYIRGFLSATIAPGGLGKTSLQLVEAVGMVCGRALLKGTTARPLNVWYWNLEDPRDEIDRRIAAILLHYKIPPGSSPGRLFVNTEEPLVIAAMARDEAVVAAPVVGRLMSEIVRLQIDVLTVDPFVSSHKVPENDNGAIDTVAKTWSRVARTGNCAVEVAHHIRKPSSGSTAEITVDDAEAPGR